MAFRKHHSTSATAAAATAKKRFHRGRGILNSAINKLPFELHYPGYHFLGPGTKLRKRIAQGDKGINKLDEAAKRHDLFYEQHKDTKSRHSADKALENEAWERVKAPDSKLSEKVAAYLTTNAMKVKRFLGAGLKKKLNKRRNQIKKKSKQIRKKKKRQQQQGTKRKRKMMKKAKPVSFNSIVRIAKNSIKKNSKKRKNLNDNDILGLTSKALKAVHLRGKKLKRIVPRIIPIPKTGGVLPLVPILAGLASISTIASNAPSIIKTIKNIINYRKLGNGISSPIGNGLYLAPYKKGYGLFLNPHQQPKNL